MAHSDPGPSNLTPSISSPPQSTVSNFPPQATVLNSPPQATVLIISPPQPTVLNSPPQSSRNNQNPMDQLAWSERNRLYHAALSGDYATAHEIIKTYPDVLNEDISQSGRNETVLHVAVGAKQTHFVTQLLDEFKDNVKVSQRNINGHTAFFLACAVGDLEIVQYFLHRLTKDEFLASLDYSDVSAFQNAVLYGHLEVASLLYDHTVKSITLTLDQPERYEIFFSCINNDFYDLALRMLESNTFAEDVEMGRQADTNLTALHLLSRKPPSVFATPKTQGLHSTIYSRFFGKSPRREESDALKLVKELWNRTLRARNYDFFDIVREIKTPFHLLMEATKVGNLDFVVVLINSYPELIWEFEDDDENKRKNVFYYAVNYRQVEIFKLIHEVGLPKRQVQIYEDGDGNNLLHVAAHKPPDSRLRSIVGSALQMREQILWFQEVREIVAPSLRNKMNSSCITPQELFTEQHNELMKESEKWMKRSANICLLVATIIVTVIFQANFDITGDDKAGSKPPLIKDILLITHNIAMCTSSVAVMLNLFIITSRFSEDDLFRPLPCAFIGGIILLYIAITCMLTSFFLTTIFATKSLAVRISAYLLNLLPIYVYHIFVLPLIRDLSISRFFSKLKFKPGKRMLGCYYGKKDIALRSDESQSRSVRLEFEELETGTRAT